MAETGLVMRGDETRDRDGKDRSYGISVDCAFELAPAQVSEWNDFLDHAQHAHPRQSAEFARVETAIGRKPLFAIGRRDGRIVALALFSLLPSRWASGRFSLATALSGPICDDAATMVDFLRALATAPALRRVDAMSITPYWLNAEAEDLADQLQAAGWRASEPADARSTGLIDISMPEAQLIASFSHGARRKLKAKALREVEIRPITDEAEAGQFYDQLNRRILIAHNLTPISEAEQRASFQPVYCNPRLGILLGAFHEGTFLGGFLIYRSASTVFARRYVVDTDVAKVRVAPSLWLQGMLWAKSHGCTAMDVEGFRIIEDRTHPDFNHNEYKRELATVLTHRIPEHVLPLNPIGHFLNRLPRLARRFVRTRFPGLANALRPH